MPDEEEGVAEVVSCSKCSVLIVDDVEHANREQHAMVAHGLHATQ